MAKRKLLSLIAVITLLTACNGTMPSLPQLQAPTPEEAERALAQQRQEEELEQVTAMKQLASLDLGLANIPTAQAYLDRLLTRIQEVGPQPARLAKVVIRPKLSYNASTTPNGIIVVDLGWLKTIDKEAELAALLAHEYGHIALGHLKNKNQVGTAVYAVTTVASVYAQSKGINNDWALALVGGGWSSLLKTSWSRDQEYEADAFAFDLTQKMGYAYVASMRAFLDRVQSIEKSAKPTTKRTTSSLAVAATVDPSISNITEDHPPIEERIMRLQKMAEGQPRKRPAPQSTDGWRTTRDAAAFKTAEKEVVLASQLLDASVAANKTEQATFKKQIEALRPLKTAAALTMLAFVEPQSARRATYLQQAIAAPDTPFMAYRLLATMQRDESKQYAEADKTLETGLDRFESPPQHWPDVLAFYRATLDMTNAVPQNQRNTALSIYETQLNFTLLQMQTKCQLKPEVAQACNWAAMNEQQKQVALSKQNMREQKMINQLSDKLNLK